MRSTSTDRLRLVPAPTPEAEAQAIPTFTDAEVVAAIRAGSSQVGAALYQRVRPVVGRTLYRLLGRNDADYEDLAQKAMIEFVYSIDRYRGDCSLDSWISTLTAHQVYKLIRRRKLERRLFDRFAEDAVARLPAVPMQRTVIAKQVLGRLSKHLATLDSDKSWAYLLHDVCGYDLVEISRITGVSVAAAQSRLARGRRALHEKIARDPELAGVLEALGDKV